jgi:malate synthase
MAAWLSGNGCVPIYNLMEDAATAEISRSQLWQWLHHPDVTLDDGRGVTAELMGAMMDEETEKLRTAVGDDRFEAGRYELARSLIESIVNRESFTEFMTIVGYEHLD